MARPWEGPGGGIRGGVKDQRNNFEEKDLIFINSYCSKVYLTNLEIHFTIG